MKITPTPAQVAAMMRPKRSKYNVDRSAYTKAEVKALTAGQYGSEKLVEVRR